MMMDRIRRASQGLLGRIVVAILFGFLIISFVIWGIGDMFRGQVSDKVAQVGGATITAQQYQTQLQNMMYQYQTQTRSGLTTAQARALGLDADVLQRMIADTALDQRAASLGLAISDDAIAAAVRADPNLQDASGQFSRERFDAALRNTGLSERGFFAAQSAVYLRQQIELSLAAGLQAPKALVDALARVKAQTRAIDYLVLPSSAAGAVPAPSLDVLKRYFDDRKGTYRAPEYRGFDILLVSPSSLAKPSEVSEEDAKALYDKVRETRFGVPEKRDVQQIVFPSEAEADDAQAKIKAGASFDDILTARKLTATEVDLGEQTKAGMFDKAVAEAAFALPKDGVSDVVKGRFGPVILRVVSITPANIKAFPDVAEALKKEIATDRATGDAQALHDKIEDARVAGKTLPEAAKTVGLETRTIAAVDAQGLDPNGAAVDLPEKELLLRSAFASDVGVDNASLQTRDHGFLWFEIDKVEPARDRTFDEAKAKVETQWRADEAARGLAAKAQDLVKQLAAGASLADLAKSVGVEAKSASGLHRGAAAGGLPEDVIAAVFTTPPSGAGSASTPDGRVVFKITADETPPTDANAPATKEIATRLSEALQTSVVAQYVAALERELGVTINESVLQAAEGG